MSFRRRLFKVFALSIVALIAIIGFGIVLNQHAQAASTIDHTGGASHTNSLNPITFPPQHQAAAVCSNAYTQRFMAQWNSMIKSTSGVVNPNGYLKVIGSDLLPYHSVETMMIEAPDQGHEFSSETLSYMLWLNARYGEYTGDFSFYQNTWNVIQKYAIPSATDQPNGGTGTAQYAGEFNDPSLYPAALDASVPTGTDPFFSELQSTYGNTQIYGMHWIFDGDNFYGFGNHNDGTSQVAYINTFQRGPQESTWEVIPQPSWDNEVWGEKNGSSYAGFGPYFVGGLSGAAKKYSYTDAPDADARAVQVAYWATQWAANYPGVALTSQNAQAAKLGDFLRYALAEKYFKNLSCTPVTRSCAGGTGKTMLHYLISWYYAWGGDASGAGAWAWRIGDYAAHMGYQNPMAAWVLSTSSTIKPMSPTAPTDWGTSLNRMLDFYQWLQSAEGAIAGGAEFGQVSASGSYTTAPSGTVAFNNMTYVANPVYLDPGSNTWFGFQAWSMERLAEYYYLTGNAQAASIITKWASWVKTSGFTFATGTNGEDVQVASTISWSGAPAASFTSGSSHPGANSGLHVTVVNYGADMGTMASAAQALTWYAAATQKWGTLDTAAQTLAKRVLDDQWNNHRTASGVTAPEARSDYSRFLNQVVFFPAGSSGRTPKCGLHSTPTDCLVPGATFAQIRPQYQDDVDYARVVAAINAGTAPTFTFHRFWGQTDVAVANAAYGDFFGGCGATPTTGPTATTGPSATPVPPTKTNTPGPTPTKPPATNTFVPPTATTGSTAVSGSLVVNIDKGGGTDNTQETTFNFQIKNNGSSAVSNLSVRIYFNTDGSNAASGYMMEKYYDQSGVATISTPTAACGATNYFTVSYGTASLAAGASWEFQTALHLTSWGSTYDGSNDWYHSGYAVGALPAAYTATNFIPAYVNGTLTAGSTPSCGGTTVPTNPPPTATKPPATATTGPTATKPPATNTPVPPTKTNTPVATSSGNCTPTSTITAPFTFDGAGTLCWKTNSLGSYINSWNLASLTINGVNITNVYVASGSYPAKASDGFWYIAYNSTVSFGHFETK